MFCNAPITCFAMHIANVAIKGVSECERREAAAMGNGIDPAMACFYI